MIKYIITGLEARFTWSYQHDFFNLLNCKIFFTLPVSTLDMTIWNSGWETVCGVSQPPTFQCRWETDVSGDIARYCLHSPLSCWDRLIDGPCNYFIFSDIRMQPVSLSLLVTCCIHNSCVGGGTLTKLLLHFSVKRKWLEGFGNDN